MISFVLPTRDRPERLKRTLLRLGALDPKHLGAAEVIVVDNASRERAILPATLDNGLRVGLVQRPTNEGAAARNAGVAATDPSSAWIVMLDDDSYPVDADVARALASQPADVAAVSADIHLPEHRQRESGGLPEVFIGCGVALRRGVFLELGGYDPAFNYYVEEYDLAARLLLAGHRVAFSSGFRVEHAKDARHRDMNLILARLVRNNSWIAQRYAPDRRRLAELREVRRRYRAIAEKEDSIRGFAQGLRDARRTLRAQARRPMPPDVFDRFTGLTAARTALAAAQARHPFRSAAIVDAGKNAWVVEEVLREMGVLLTAYGQDAEVHIIGTMSPGPMLDAYAKRLAMRRGRGPRVLAPWVEAMPELTQRGGALAAA